MATWPSTLPSPLASGYALNPGDQTIRTDMEMGAPRVRRRTTARNDRVSVSWVLTEPQFKALRDWFDDDVAGIAGGSAWFAVTLAVGGSVARETTDARFDGPLKAELVGRIWRVAATLEVR